MVSGRKIESKSMPIYVPDSDEERQCHLTGKRKSQSTTLHHSGAQKRVKSEPESSAKQVDQKSLRYVSYLFLSKIT